MSRPASDHGLVYESLGLAIEVSSDDPRLLQYVPGVLLPGWSPADGASPAVRFGIGRDGAITVDGVELARHENLTVAFIELGKAIRHHLALHAPAHIFIHAGVVSVEGLAIVMPGRSFSGKTTLVAELVRAGATYYSDEYAVVDALGRIHPYLNPLTLRCDPRSGDRNVVIHPRGDRVGAAPIRAGMIVITSYEEGASWNPEPCTSGEGAIALLENTVAARSRPSRALAAARLIADGARVASGVRGEAAVTAREMLSALGHPLTFPS
jgi:hypothetical protein